MLRRCGIGLSLDGDFHVCPLFKAHFLPFIIRQGIVDAYFSIQMIPASTVICAFSGMLGNGGLMIFSTVPGRMVLGFSSMVSLCTNRFANHFRNPSVFLRLASEI